MWFRLLSELYKHGRKNHIDAGNFAGANRLEFDFVAGSIEFPTTRPLSPTVPESVPQPTTDNKIIEYFENYIMDGFNLAENEHYRYATWINGGYYTLPKAFIMRPDLTAGTGSISSLPLKVYVFPTS